MSDDRMWTRGPARRPAAQVADPLLQWATGLQTRDRRVYAGWLVEAGKSDDLDLAMQQAGFPKVTIKHGGGEFVNHWAVETANVFVVAEGVQSLQDIKNNEERFGVVLGWKTLDGGRPQSFLKARVFLRELLEVGYREPLLLTVKSTITGDIIQAFARQYDVLDAIDAFRQLDKKPVLNPPFYACSIPLGPGQEVQRGSGGNTKEITPPVALTPSPVTKDYVRSHWIKRDWSALIEGMLDGTIQWSIVTSKALVGGDDREHVDGSDPEARSYLTNGQRRTEESLL